jgi:preprotein translocase subunit SecG
MYAIFVVLHILICLVLCVVILLQSSKGGGLAGAFGGGGAPQQIFGTRGMTTLLHKITIYCAVGFFLTSATLFALTTERTRTPGSVVEEARERGALPSEAGQSLPAEPAPFPDAPEEGLPPGEATSSGTESMSDVEESAERAVEDGQSP